MPRGKRGTPPEDSKDIAARPAKAAVVTAELESSAELKPFPTTGIYAEFLADDSPEILLEGSLSCAKTTIGLVKFITHLRDDNGLAGYLCRYSDEDLRTKLRPAFEKVCHEMQVYPVWENTEKCYLFANGSRCSAFGLRSVDAMSRYSKLKGLTSGEILVDEAQELPGDIASELRARNRQPGHSHRLVFVANPPPDGHWLTKQFKDEAPDNPNAKEAIVFNRAHHRRVYRLSLYDNPFLPAETLRSMEATYPPEHAKYPTLVMGRRGPDVQGDPIYGELFSVKLHVRPIEYKPDQILFEAFDFGKDPCWVVAQKPFSGGIYCLGGILGQGMFLDDFLPIVKQYRAEWFPELGRVRTCCTASTNLSTHKITQIHQLREAGFNPIWNEHANDPDVVLALIEKIASYMRRRSATGKEAFGINNDESHWLRASSEGIAYSPFMTGMAMNGYTWDLHTVSVGRNEMRQPRSDSWFEYPGRCLEAIELNFGLTQELEQAAIARQKKAQRDNLPRQYQPQGWME